MMPGPTGPSGRAGWHRALTVGLGLLAACGPGGEPSPACPAGQVQDEESGACVAERCGADAWGPLDRSSATVYVAPWGDDAGDGSEQQPLLTIQAGVDRAGDAGGAPVAVAAGTWVENLELGSGHDGVQLNGRCAELVTIDGSGQDEPGVLAIRAAVGIRGVTVTGGQGGVWVEHSGFGGATDVHLEEVVLSGNATAGLLVIGAGAGASVVGSEISHSQPTGAGDFGFGIQVSAGATLVGRELLLDGNHLIGLQIAHAGTTANLESVTVRETQPGAMGTHGRGIAVQEGASLVARGLVLERNHDLGLIVGHVGTTVELEDSTVRDTQPLPEGPSGWGIAVQSGSSLVARDLLVTGNHDVGLLAGDAGTTVDLEDATIGDTLPVPGGSDGRGLSVQGGARLVARGLLLEANHDVGLTAVSAGTTVDLEDATVRGSLGRGMEVSGGASLVARTLLLEENHEIGLIAAHTGTSVSLQDATIRDTGARPGGDFGHGINVDLGASLVARTLLLDRNHGIGLLSTSAGTSVDLTDATIRETQPRLDGTGGGGAQIHSGADLVVRGLVVEGNHDYGLSVAHTGTTVDLEDATIRDTRARSDGSWGRGIGLQDGAGLVARGLVLEENRDVGLVVAHDGTSADLEDVRISGTRTSAASASGAGVIVQQSGSLTVQGLEVEDCEGPGLYVVADGDLEAWDAVLRRNAFSGVVVLDGRLALRRGAISGSEFHPSEGGGVGVFAWDGSDVEVEDLDFSELRGPALYLRGPGRYVVRGCEVRDAGAWPWFPGGVLAVEGVGRWAEDGGGSGLLLVGDVFEELTGDAVLLDASSATLAPHPDTGSPNVFTDLEGEPVVQQRCEGVPELEVLDGSLVVPGCEAEPRILGPLLEYRLRLAEAEPIDQ